MIYRNGHSYLIMDFAFCRLIIATLHYGAIIVAACACAACQNGTACSGDSADIQPVKFHGARICPLLPQ
jgi:hypothetical protein